MSDRRKNVWAIIMAAVLLVITCGIQVALNNMQTAESKTTVFMPSR